MNQVIRFVVNNFSLMMLIYIVSLVGAASAFTHYESVSFIDSIYWATCTSLTIGYGDYSPHNDSMKLITIIIAHFWAFIVIPSVIIKFFMQFVEDKDSFTHEEQEEIKLQLSQLIKRLNNESK